MSSFTAKNVRLSANTARARNMPHIVVHSSLELPQLQMVRPWTLPVLQEPVPLSEVNESIHQICPVSRKRRDPRSRTGRSRTRHNNPRPSKMTQVLLQHHHKWEETHSHPFHHKDNSSISTHHHLWVDTCIHPHHHHSSIYHKVIRSLYSKILIWLLQYNRWPSSINNQTKALENIISTSSFTSTMGCIPIYNGKDKDVCTKWLQKCKEASFYTGYNFRSALLQRSSQDVAKVI